MTEKQKGGPPPGMNLDDILYIIFRHKWKILTISALGVIGALSLPHFLPASYESEAKLYVRYVLETRAPTQTSENDARIRSPDARGDSIINTELEILTSRDLAQKVAAAIGPERFLDKGQGANLEQAALVVQAGVKAQVPKDSSVVRLVFRHHDPAIVQPVLSQLINSYFKKHAEIHAVGAFDDFLTQETDQLRSRLVQTEEELRKAKAKAGVISLDDAKKAYGEGIGKIQQQLLEAEAELAERRAAVQEIVKATHIPGTVSTNQAQLPNYSTVPPQKLEEYRQVCGLLETLRLRRQELSASFTPAYYLVKAVDAQIAENQQVRQRLEAENPGLLTIGGSEAKSSAIGQTSAPGPDLVSETVRASALEGKVKVLTAQLDEMSKRAASVADAEGPIIELQRQRDLEETHYRKFSENLAQSQLDEKLGAGKVSNISVIEEPTPPQKAQSKTASIMAGLLFGSIAGALGLAFLIEVFLDQSIRRAAEVETKIGLPLFLSIPLIPGNGHMRMLKGGSVQLLAEENQRESNPGGRENQPSVGMQLVQPQRTLPLQRYYEALRDRLISYLEMKNLTHKPKLVAVTSCHEGSGVSTTAAGLAASLSETGDGNVLLVNMNLQNGAAHHFHKGELACSLEEALETDKRAGALVRENLYVVHEGTAGDELSPILPKRFKQLVPRLKASDFDYIIFDMPPVSPISLTARLGRFMDVVLMVVESGKTGRETVKKAAALLAESHANVGVVLNKGRKYVPQWLKHDL